jgi:hypothetical protein
MSAQNQPRYTVNLTFFFAGTGMLIEEEGGGQLSQWYQAIATNYRNMSRRPSENKSVKYKMDGCGVEFGVAGGLFGVGMREQAQDSVYTIRESMSRFPGYKYNINLVGFSRGGVTALLVLKALSVGSALPECRVNILTIDPVPGVPKLFADTGIALESWRVMRELLPMGDCPGGVRRAIYFDTQLKFHTALGVSEDWDRQVFSGCHAGAVRRIELGSPRLPELMFAAGAFYQFVQEAGIPNVDFTHIFPRQPGEESLSVPEYLNKKQAEFIAETSEITNKNEQQVHPEVLSRIFQHELTVPCFCPAIRGSGIVIKGLASGDIKQKQNDTFLPRIKLDQAVDFLRLLMHRLPLQLWMQRTEEGGNSTLAAYRMLSDSMEMHAPEVSAKSLRAWFGCLLVVCLQPRKKQVETENGLALLSAIRGINRVTARDRQVIKAHRQLLKYVFGDYSNQFLSYPMLMRHAANALYRFVWKARVFKLPETVFPYDPTHKGVKRLLSSDRVEDNLVIVSSAIAGVGR